MNWSGLICEDKLNISLGRICFWFLVILMTYFWLISSKEVPPSLVSSFEWVLGYNLGKKLVNIIPTVVTTMKG